MAWGVLEMLFFVSNSGIQYAFLQNVGFTRPNHQQNPNVLVEVHFFAYMTECKSPRIKQFYFIEKLENFDIGKLLAPNI